MKTWKKAPWKEVLTVKNGKNQKKVENERGKYPIYGSGGVMGRADEYLCEEGTTVIGRKGSINNPLFVEEKFWNVDTAFGLVAGSRLDKKYLFYFCKTFNFFALNKATTLPSLTKTDLLQIEIPLPPLTEQRRIASLLDAVDKLRQQDKALIECYNALAQSVFLEMFGDPVRNERGWVEIALVNAVRNPNDIKCGPFGTQLSKSEYQQEGVPIWGIPQVNSKFKLKPTEYLTDRKAGELEDYSVLTGDIVMSRKGNVGKCAIYPEHFSPGVLHSDVLRVRPDRSIANPVFLSSQFMISRRIETQIEMVSSGAIMAGINVSKLKNIAILLPPLPLQEKFAAIIENIEAQKRLAEASLAESEALFQSLLQRAFKGEL